jgi:hypothetical protein
LIGKTSGGACVITDTTSYPNYDVFVPSPNLNLATYRIHTKATNRFWVRRNSDQVINTLSQLDSDSSRFNFFRNSDGTYRLVADDTKRELLNDENVDGRLKATGNSNDDYARFYVEQVADQGSYRLRTFGGRESYLREGADRLIVGRESIDNSDAFRVLLEPSYPTRLQFSASRIDFGSVRFGVPTSRTFTLTNPGTERVPFSIQVSGAGYVVTGIRAYRRARTLAHPV